MITRGLADAVCGAAVELGRVAARPAKRKVQAELHASAERLRRAAGEPGYDLAVAAESFVVAMAALGRRIDEADQRDETFLAFINGALRLAVAALLAA